MLCNNYRPKLKLEDLSKEAFDGMNKTERVNCVFKEGRELLCRENPNYIISLYLVKDFFVEVWYLPKSRRIDRIELTTNEEVMANYEEEIDLADLF